MEISRLLPASTTSSAPQGPRATSEDGADFAEMLKQGKAASSKEPGNDKASDTDSNPLAKEPESETDGLSGQSAATVPGAAPQARTPAAELSPLMQNIAQAISTQLASQPTQPPVIADTATSALKVSQTALNGETLGLAAIRERLTTIANAQRGAALPTPAVAGAAGLANAMPYAGQTALDIAKGALPRIDDRLASLQDQATASHHRPMTAQGMQPIGSQDVAAAAPPASQSATFMEAIASQSAAADLPLAGRSGGDGHASQTHALTGNLAGTTSGASAQAQATPAQLLNAPLATPQWQQGLGQQLVALHQRGAQQMELHLRPADLGPLSISLKVDDQLAQLQLFSTNPQVRAAIEQAIPQLRQALEESGIQLGEAMVGEQRQQHDGDSRSADTALASRDDDLRGTSTEELDVVASAARPLAGNGNAVDLYA